MIRIIGISGSLRRESYNTSLLRAAIALARPGVEIVEASIRGVPLYDGDLEAAKGIPQAVSTLKEAIVAADGLLMVTPEYNNSIPGVFKNAIDWLSRPSADIKRVFGGRCVGLIGCSNGPFATTLSQAAWLPVLRTLGTNPYFGARLLVPRSGSVFDAEGALVSEEIGDRLAKYLEGFSDFVDQQRRIRAVADA